MYPLSVGIYFRLNCTPLAVQRLLMFPRHYICQCLVLFYTLLLLPFCCCCYLQGGEEEADYHSINTPSFERTYFAWALDVAK